ncbi:hypothetical protein OAK58_02045, partial [bacterium]|nr:hypothetical protein [bacterium]
SLDSPEEWREFPQGLSYLQRLEEATEGSYFAVLGWYFGFLHSLLSFSTGYIPPLARKASCPQADFL